MKLFAHPDFEQAIIAAGVHFESAGLRPAMIEKDYYVTEALRIIADSVGDRVIFKGGTSLSKGWNLIQRFSEDIDIFLDPMASGKAQSKRGIDRELRKLRDTIAAHPAFSFLADESKTIGGFGRNDYFAYPQRLGVDEIAGRILVEAGTASGREPTETVELRSYLAEFILESGNSLNCDDEQGFPLPLLHFRRTFVEKMFAIHAKVERYKREGITIGSFARHYYDLAQLAARSEVLAMLKTIEYASIKEDYDRISRESFPRQYVCPEAMSFSTSDALFPGSELAGELGKEYERQCRILCYGPYPPWGEVLGRFEGVRHLL